MKEPGLKTFLFPFVAYFAMNVAYTFYWDKKPITMGSLTGSALSAIFFSAITWFFAYRKYAKAEVNS
ncbi:hypothetical protein [Terriglobus saanensis]|uniref:Uncharacterized protein n=1 Tax=Terriglobus saanensis (strain ATCC BAA-1853 / DSM 23119 / SP1PR4) TaxID=401053 RepID=E8UZ29_TERSS|nr:hypothetical protein [Terriglobus saanensis]ADV80974.1 hypothetical protein AciPR4_0133 [Terriglobus saanensis SP1PR4]